jgi:hypothetical protein
MAPKPNGPRYPLGLIAYLLALRFSDPLGRGALGAHPLGRGARVLGAARGVGIFGGGGRADGVDGPAT